MMSRYNNASMQTNILDSKNVLCSTYSPITGIGAKEAAD